MLSRALSDTRDKQVTPCRPSALQPSSCGVPLRTGGLRIQRLRIVGQHLGERAVLLRGQEWLWVKKRVPVGRVG